MAADNDKAPDIAELERSIQEKMQNLEAGKAEPTVQHETIAKSDTDVDTWNFGDAMTISSGVLLFGCLLLILATSLLHKGKTAEDVLKLFGTMIIVISAVFLVVAGYTDTQIAPVVGLLGTIAGYLLGRENKENEQEKKD